MRTLILLLLLTFSIKAQKTPIPDNIKHLLAGTIISAVVSDVTYQITDRMCLSLGVGLTAGIGAGFAKEYIWDQRMGRGYKSKQDIIDTTVGSCVGTFGMFIIIQSKKDRERERIQEFERRKRIFEE